MLFAWFIRKYALCVILGFFYLGQLGSVFGELVIEKPAAFAGMTSKTHRAKFAGRSIPPVGASVDPNRAKQGRNDLHSIVSEIRASEPYFKKLRWVLKNSLDELSNLKLIVLWRLELERIQEDSDRKQRAWNKLFGHDQFPPLANLETAKKEQEPTWAYGHGSGVQVSDALQLSAALAYSDTQGGFFLSNQTAAGLLRANFAHLKQNVEIKLGELRAHASSNAFDSLGTAYTHTSQMIEELCEPILLTGGLLHYCEAGVQPSSVRTSLPEGIVKTQRPVRRALHFHVKFAELSSRVAAASAVLHLGNATLPRVGGRPSLVEFLGNLPDETTFRPVSVLGKISSYGLGNVKRVFGPQWYALDNFREGTSKAAGTDTQGLHIQRTGHRSETLLDLEKLKHILERGGSGGAVSAAGLAASNTKHAERRSGFFLFKGSTAQTRYAILRRALYVIGLPIIPFKLAYDALRYAIDSVCHISVLADVCSKAANYTAPASARRAAAWANKRGITWGLRKILESGLALKNTVFPGRDLEYDRPEKVSLLEVLDQIQLAQQQASASMRGGMQCFTQSSQRTNYKEAASAALCIAMHPFMRSLVSLHGFKTSGLDDMISRAATEQAVQSRIEKLLRVKRELLLSNQAMLDPDLAQQHSVAASTANMTLRLQPDGSLWEVHSSHEQNASSQVCPPGSAFDVRQTGVTQQGVRQQGCDRLSLVCTARNTSYSGFLPRWDELGANARIVNAAIGPVLEIATPLGCVM